MHLRTLTLSSQLCAIVASSAAKLMSPANETAPFSCYDYLSLYHPEEHTAITELLTAVTKGSVCVPCVCVCVSGLDIVLEPVFIFSGGKDHQLLPSSTNQILGLNERAHTLAFDIIFAQLKDKLSRIPQLKVSHILDIML